MTVFCRHWLNNWFLSYGADYRVDIRAFIDLESRSRLLLLLLDCLLSAHAALIGLSFTILTFLFLISFVLLDMHGTIGRLTNALTHCFTYSWRFFHHNYGASNKYSTNYDHRADCLHCFHCFWSYIIEAVDY